MDSESIKVKTEIYEEKEYLSDQFYNNKEYMNLIDEFMYLNIDSDDYSEHTRWTDETDIMFSFLYHGANSIEDFEEDI